MTLDDLFNNAGQGTDTTVSASILTGNIWPGVPEGKFTGTLTYGVSRVGVREQAHFSGLVTLAIDIANVPKFLVVSIVAPIQSTQFVPHKTPTEFVPGSSPYMAILIANIPETIPPVGTIFLPVPEIFNAHVTSTSASSFVGFDNNPNINNLNAPFVSFSITP